MNKTMYGISENLMEKNDLAATSEEDVKEIKKVLAEAGVSDSGVSFTDTINKVTEDDNVKVKINLKKSKPVKMLKEKFTLFCKKVGKLYQKIKEFFNRNKEKTLEEEVNEIELEKENSNNNVEEDIKEENSSKKKKFKGGFIKQLLVNKAIKDAGVSGKGIHVSGSKINMFKNLSLEEREDIAKEIAANAGVWTKVDESKKENKDVMPVADQSIDNSKKEEITNPIDNSVNIVTEVQETEQTAMEQADLNAKYREIIELGNEVTSLVREKEVIVKDVEAAKKEIKSLTAVLNETVGQEKNVEAEVKAAELAKEKAKADAESEKAEAEVKAEENIKASQASLANMLELQKETLLDQKNNITGEIKAKTGEREVIKNDVAKIVVATTESKTKIEELVELKKVIEDEVNKIKEGAKVEVANINKKAASVVAGYDKMTESLSGFVAANQKTEESTIATVPEENFVGSPVGKVR